MVMVSSYNSMHCTQQSVVLQPVEGCSLPSHTELMHRRLYNTPIQAHLERLVQLAVIINPGSSELFWLM